VVRIAILQFVSCELAMIRLQSQSYAFEIRFAIGLFKGQDGCRSIFH
jgi:hypothetical protein